MKKFIKENWFKILLVIVAISLFYWYEWRPVEIRKECSFIASDKAKKTLKTKAEINDDFNKFIEKGLFLKDDYESHYKNCLRENGL